MNGIDKIYDYFVYINYIRYYFLNYNFNLLKGNLYIISVGN